MTNVTHKPRRTPARQGRAAVMALALLGMLTACDGDNLFTGNTPAGGGAPRVTVIDVPQSVREGDRLDIVVKAVAPGGMAAVHMRYRRAVDQDPTPVLPATPGRTDTVTFIVPPLQIPDEAKDSVLVVDVWAVDQQGRVSEIVTRVIPVTVRSGPIVSAIVTPSSVSMGDTVRVRVSARHHSGLRFVGYALISATGDTLPGSPRLEPVSGTAVDTVFTLVLPTSLQPTDLRVIGLAVNSADLRGVSAPLQLSVVDLLPPEVRILTPSAGASHPLSDSIFVRVHVADSAGVAEVRLRGEAIRRDSLQNTTVVTRYAQKTVVMPGLPNEMAPRDTTLVRYLLPVGGDVSEDVHIIAEAIDLGGNMSADTVVISDGPRVQIMNLADNSNVGMNRMLLVHVNAMDRTAGLDSVKLIIGGLRDEVQTIRNLYPLESVDTTFSVNIGSVAGQLTLQPRVWNRNTVPGTGQTVRLNVTAIETSDSERPRVLRTISSSDRLELTDTVRVVVRATDGDGSGVARMGMVAVVSADTDQLNPREVYRTSAVFAPPLGGTPERTFTFTIGDVFNELETTYPRRFTLQVHAFAVDAAGNCGASVSAQLTAAVCSAVDAGGQTYYRAAEMTPASYQVTGTIGRSVRLPGGGRIADAVVDEARRRIYLSNIEQNKIDVFLLAEQQFAPLSGLQGRVGAAPWGMVIANDSLFVANSGGTNISVMPLAGSGWPVEARRISTPNLVLYDVSMDVVEGKLRYVPVYTDYSDRPQFIAEHASGMLLFSTLPTMAARDGTLRYVDRSAGREETYLLHTGATTPDPKSIAISQIDSMTVVRAADGDDRVILFDHHPATGAVIVSDTLTLTNALEDLRTQGSDVEWYAGRWSHDAMGLADTTYVAASADRSTIAFGEGAKAPFGRVFICCTIQSTDTGIKLGLSSQMNVVDLVNNAAERVFGLALNTNGQLGVARGSESAYYFDRSLRLQGEFRSGMANGAGGAVLHPLHAGMGGSAVSRLSFVPTSSRTIKLIDSYHFFERGEIHIRDNVVGPVRAFMPTAADNTGLSASHPNYILVRLLAVTEDSHVVVIDVRNRDLDN
jgi:hypothetical protein